MSVISESKFLIQKIAQKQLFINYLHPIMPFCLFKLPSLSKELSDPKICLPMNRFTDPETLVKSSSYISLWSQSHLQNLFSLKNRSLLNVNKLILKSPFKSQQLIKRSLNLGIRNMLIQDFEQMAKIHKCRCSQKELNDPMINFIWNVTDCQGDLQKLKILNSYKIRINNLMFSETYSRKFPLIKEFIQKANELLQEKGQIRKIYLETKEETFTKSKEHFNNHKFYQKNNIQVVIENNDFTMTDKYFIGVKIIGETKNKQHVINQQAKYYINEQNLKKCEVIQNEGNKWVLTQINHFPEAEKMQQHRKKGLIVHLN